MMATPPRHAQPPPAAASAATHSSTTAAAAKAVAAAPAESTSGGRSWLSGRNRALSCHESLRPTPTRSCCEEFSGLLKPPQHKRHEQRHRLQQQQQQPSHMPAFSRHVVLAAVALAVCSLLLPATLASPVFVDNPSLAQFQSGRNIRHLPCIVRKSGRSGVCMFAIDCIKRNGTHLGTCIDRFYFGSCCQMQDETPLYAPEISDNSIDQNTISHFVHESTTLPTSALFKLTTESSSHVPSAESSKNTTSVDSTHSTTVSRSPSRPTVSSSSSKPISNTTPPHKNSHFVVRTTTRTKPPPMGKPTIEPTTIKPPKRKTPTRPPLLTTAATALPQVVEERTEFTTPPQKLFTFQVVETTAGTATEVTSYDAEVPTLTTTSRRRPTIGDAITTAATRPVASRPKPSQASRRPTTTSTPTQTRRTPGRPTRKPVVTSTTGTPVRPGWQVTSPPTTVRRPPGMQATTQAVLTTTTNTDEVKTTQSTAREETTTATRAPRPKPRPTAEIVKVPRPSVGVAGTTAKPAPTTTTKTATTTTTVPAMTASSPTTQKDSDNSSTTVKTQLAPKPSLKTTTTTAPSTKIAEATTTTTTTQKPTTTSTTRRATTPTTTRVTLTLNTTEPPKLDLTTASTTATKTATATTVTTATMTTTTTITTTTLKPGVGTWTNLDGKPLMNTTAEEDWQPRPPPPDWVPVPTIAPETHANKTTASSSTAGITTEGPEATSTQKVIVSITSSISEAMSNATAAKKPVSAASSMTTTTPHPPTQITATEGPATDLASPTATTESTSSTATTASTTTSTSISGSSTTMDSVTTEDVNSILNSSTETPVNTLEGVDYRNVCGRRMFPEPRIVGGSNAAFGRWPWQISLRQWRTSTYLHKCGAALLNENWAITAAHCVDNVPPSDLLLRLGEYDLAEEEEPYSYQERRVQIVASHPQFDPRTFEYDLALLRFYEPVVFQPNIIPVCVPESDYDFIGQTAFVTGWGRLYEDGPLPSVLQEVAVPVINNTICETMYRAAGYIEHIPHIFICAGWKKGGYDSCEGDSGGPMVLQREEDKRFLLGGVISWGIGCAEANQPGVYTRISEFRDWINQILQF